MVLYKWLYLFMMMLYGSTASPQTKARILGKPDMQDSHSFSGANNPGVKVTHHFEPIANLADGKHGSQKLFKRFCKCFRGDRAIKGATVTHSLEETGPSRYSKSGTAVEMKQRSSGSRTKKIADKQNHPSRSKAEQVSSREDPEDSEKDFSFTFPVLTRIQSRDHPPVDGRDGVNSYYY